MRNFTVMYKDEAVARVEYSGGSPLIKKYTSLPAKQPFIGNYEPKRMVYDFLKSRCFDNGRADLGKILLAAGLSSNDPYEWCIKTHGVTYDDMFWIKYDGEVLTWTDMNPRGTLPL